jgi:hypothetical protein
MKRNLLALMLGCAALRLHGVDRYYIRDAIDDMGSCRTVAITETQGNLALGGRNSYAFSGIPSGLVDELEELHHDGEFIRDVQLTEGGAWLILYEGGIIWDAIPKELEAKLREFDGMGERILSVSFNDAGDWAAVTENYFSASSETLTARLSEGYDSYGQLLTVALTGNAALGVFAEGYLLRGKVPNGLKRALRDTDLQVSCVKIAGQAWFLADAEGKYEYDM